MSDYRRKVDLERALCHALGLDEQMVVGIEIRLSAVDLPQVTVEMVPDGDRLGQLETVVRRFRLHPEEYGAVATPSDEGASAFASEKGGQ